MAFPSCRAVFVSRNCLMRNWLGASNTARSTTTIQVATLRCTYGEKYPYPKPWPYKEKKFNVLYELMEKQADRLNENTKIITVEGNHGVGKRDFAKKLAKEFDLIYVPPVPEAESFVWNKTTRMDVRDLDHMLPEDCQTYDLQKLFRDDHPERGTIGRMLILWYMDKVASYGEALLHVLSTGQGAVVVRSIFSEDVFALALKNLGWITPNFYKYYKTILIDNSLCDFLKPHLAIYLDASPEVCLERIKARKDPYEMGQNMNLKYLEAIEKAYKRSWLDQQRVYYEVMEIDWTEIGDDTDIDVVAEEVSRLTLENTDPESPKFKEWSILDEDRIGALRMQCQDGAELENYVLGRPGAYLCPEVYGTSDQLMTWTHFYNKHPALKYQGGTSPELGNNPNWRYN